MTDVVGGSSLHSMEEAGGHDFALAALLALSVMVPPKLYSAVALVLATALVAMAAGRIRSRYLIVILPWSMLPVVGLMGAAGNGVYDVARDLWRFITPPLYLLLGLLLYGRFSVVRVLRAFLLAAVTVSVVHLLHFVWQPSLLFLADVREVRAAAGKGHIMSAVGLVIAVAAPRFHVRTLPTRARWLGAVFVGLLLTSVVLSFSRTILASILLMSATLTGALYSINRRTILLGAGGLVVVGLLLVWAGASRGGTLETKDSFVEKLLVSGKELAIRTSYQDDAEIHAFWRGYEAYRAVLTFLEGSPREYIHGRGMGTLVDVGLKLRLGRTRFRFVPLTHNGYAYVLVKTGIVGLLLYVGFSIWLVSLGARYRQSILRESAFVGHLTAATGYMILFTTLVITGIYSYNDLIAPTVLLGAMLGSLTQADQQVLAQVKTAKAIYLSGVKFVT